MVSHPLFLTAGPESNRPPPPPEPFDPMNPVHVQNLVLNSFGIATSAEQIQAVAKIKAEAIMRLSRARAPRSAFLAVLGIGR
jgi:hypothetical protein